MVNKINATEPKTIITKEEAGKRAIERYRQRRRKLGAVDREIYLEATKETAEQSRAQARLLRAKGLSWREVGKEMGISANAAWLLAYR